MTNAKPNTRAQNIKGWSIVLCGCIFYMYQFLLRVSPNVMNSEILTNFAIDSLGISFMIGLYNWAYSGMQIPLGITIDRLGPKLFLCVATLLCACACFLFGSSTNPMIGGAARFMMGLGSACGLVGTMKLGILWLEPKHIAKVMGLVLLMGTAGASLGGVPLELLVNKIGFTNTMYTLGLLGLGIAVLVFLVVSNHPPIDHHDEIEDIYNNEHPLTDLKRLVKSPQIWLLSVYGMCMYLPITIMGVAWGVSFLTRTTGESELVAASIVSSMFIGAACGSPFFAFLSDTIKSRRKPMIFGPCVTAAIWFTVFLVDLPLYALYPLFFVAGFSYASKSLSFVSACESMPLKMSGVTIAFVNGIVMTTGIIFLPIIGKLIRSHWDGTMVNGIPYYSSGDYQFALMLVPIMISISLILALFTKETHPEKRTIPKEYGPFLDGDLI